MYHATHKSLTTGRATESVLLRLRGLSKTLAGTTILDGIDLDVRQGEFLSLLGPSGCGKTTLLRLVAGFASPDTGTIELEGVRIDQLPAARRPINTVFQNYSLFPHLTVEQNVAFGLEMLGKPRRHIVDRVAEMLELVQLRDLAKRPIQDLSGGQQQRVALARALAPAPKLVLLDEPLSALDRHLREQMQDELRHLQRRTGVSFIFVTHDQDEALALSDRVAVMNAGRIEQIATPQTIYHRPASRFVAAFVGGSNIIEGAASDGVFRCSGGELPLSSHAAGQVALVVKPEDFELSSQGLRIEILSTTFGGASVTALAHLPDGQQLTLRLRDFAPGAGGLLFVVPRRWHVLGEKS